MNNDLVSRQAAIDALDVLCQEHRYKIPGKRESYSPYNEAWQDALDRAEGAIFNLPSAEVIPVSWIEEQIEWLKGLDNGFSNLTAIQISVMVEKWRSEQKAVMEIEEKEE